LVDFDHQSEYRREQDSARYWAILPRVRRFVETLARRGYRFIAPVMVWKRWRPKVPTRRQRFTGKAGITLLPDLHVPAPHRGLVRRFVCADPSHVSRFLLSP